MTKKKIKDFTKREFKNGVVYLGDAHEILEVLEGPVFEENRKILAARKKAVKENKRIRKENKKAEKEGRKERQELIKIKDNPEYEKKHHVADICVTSPPYNLNKRYTESEQLRDQTEEEERENKSLSNNYNKKFKEWYGDFDKKIKRVKGNMSGYENVEEKDYRLDQIEMIAKLVKACSSSVFYNHKIRMAWHSRTRPINKPPSKMQHPWDWVRYFPVWCEIIWDRHGIGNPVKNRFHSQYEYMYQIGRPTKFLQGKGEDSFKDIITTEEPLEDLCSDCGTNRYFKIGLLERFLQFCGIITPRADFERQLQIWGINPSKNEGHVCTFPEKLVEHCIIPTTDKGDIIIDPYLGSGTTAIVAIKHGRRFIGIEIDPEYFELACDNIEAAEKALEEENDKQK